MVLGTSRHQNTQVGIVAARKAALENVQEVRRAPTDVLGHNKDNLAAASQIQNLQAQLDAARSEAKALEAVVSEKALEAKRWEKEAKAQQAVAEQAAARVGAERASAEEMVARLEVGSALANDLAAKEMDERAAAEEVAAQARRQAPAPAASPAGKTFPAGLGLRF